MVQHDRYHFSENSQSRWACFLSGTGWAEHIMYPRVTLLGITSFLTRSFPFGPCTSHLKHYILTLYFYKVPIAYNRKVRKKLSMCMMYMCTHTFPCECVHLHISQHTCEVKEEPHRPVLTFTWEAELCAIANDFTICGSPSQFDLVLF